MTNGRAAALATPTLDCEVVALGASFAMRDRVTGEVMHPGVGPQVEAEVLYLEPSKLRARLRGPAAASDGAPLVLWDVGLGAGSLAAIALACALEGASRKLEIVSFDCDVSAFSLALDSPNAEQLGLGAADSRVRAAAELLRRRGCVDWPEVTWRLVQGDIRTTFAGEPDGRADIVFWDMFSVKTHPDLWTEACFAGLRAKVSDSCTLHTYSFATAARTAMLLAGFYVGAGTAVGSKHETTTAAAQLASLHKPLPPEFLQRVARSTVPFHPEVLASGGRESALARLQQHPQWSSSGA